MATEDGRLHWMPVEDHAAETGIPASELVSMILDGQLPGERHGNRWYVAAPLVQWVYPDPSNDTAHLKIAACRQRSCVTAGRANLESPLAFNDRRRAPHGRRSTLR